jgi:hypothetical protein
MKYETRARRVAISVGVAAAVLAAEMTVELSLRWTTGVGWRAPWLGMVSSLAGSSVAGVLAYHLLSMRAARMLVRSELNHHVRNALQPILYYANEIEPEHRAVVKSCVERITRTLTEQLGSEAKPAVPVAGDPRVRTITARPKR